MIPSEVAVRSLKFTHIYMCVCDCDKLGIFYEQLACNMIIALDRDALPTITQSEGRGRGTMSHFVKMT